MRYRSQSRYLVVLYPVGNDATVFYGLIEGGMLKYPLLQYPNH